MKARATLEQIRAMHGRQADLDPSKPPELILVEVMGAPHWWRRVGPLAKGETLYERREDSDA